MAFKKEYISQTDNVPVFHGNVSTNTEGTLFGYPGLTVCSFYHLDSVGTQMVKGAKVTMTGCEEMNGDWVILEAGVFWPFTHLLNKPYAAPSVPCLAATTFTGTGITEQTVETNESSITRTDSFTSIAESPSNPGKALLLGVDAAIHPSSLIGHEITIGDIDVGSPPDKSYAAYGNAKYKIIGLDGVPNYMVVDIPYHGASTFMSDAAPYEYSYVEEFNIEGKSAEEMTGESSIELYANSWDLRDETWNIPEEIWNQQSLHIPTAENINASGFVKET